MENVRGKNTKRKHLSKNKKKSWRKIDTGDVDQFLEEERLQERTGGKASDKSDEALFFIEKAAKEPHKQNEGIPQRKRKAQKALTGFEETLKPPPPAKKDKRAPDVLAKLASGKKKVPVVVQRRRGPRSRNMHKTDFDLWADDSEKIKKEDPHYMRVTKKMRIQPPKHASLRPSKLPAVDVPHPGASYNPTYDDHQELLLKATQVELVKLRQEEKIRRALDEKFGQRPTEASTLKEMSAGLFDDESDDEYEDGADSDDDDDDDGDLDKLSVNPPVRRDNKKNERQRKKEQRRKDEEKKKQEEKLRRMKDNNVFRLKGIKREIASKEKLIADKIKKKADFEAEKAPYQTKRLGKQKFIEPELDLKLSDELVGSLRELKPEGCLLEDKFTNLQKRNIIETRNLVKKRRKLKMKQFEKKGHKEITG